MFEGFKHLQLQTSEPRVTIHLRYGGTGPGLLLLHGNPLTHVTWHKIAPRLAENFTVVASDLRGYGDSSKPRGQPDHSTDTFRRMAQDQVEVMEPLGFREFFSAGHDRGARSALRLALDHPDRVRARDVATDRDLALRLARPRHARPPRSLPGAGRS